MSSVTEMTEHPINGFDMPENSVDDITMTGQGDGAVDATEQNDERIYVVEQDDNQVDAMKQSTSGLNSISRFNSTELVVNKADVVQQNFNETNTTEHNDQEFDMTDAPDTQKTPFSVTDDEQALEEKSTGNGEGDGHERTVYEDDSIATMKKRKFDEDDSIAEEKRNEEDDNRRNDENDNNAEGVDNIDYGRIGRTGLATVHRRATRAAEPDAVFPTVEAEQEDNVRRAKIPVNQAMAISATGKPRKKDDATVETSETEDDEEEHGWKRRYLEARSTANMRILHLTEKNDMLKVELEDAKAFNEDRVKVFEDDTVKHQAQVLKLKQERDSLAANQDEYNSVCLATSNRFYKGRIEFHKNAFETAYEHKLEVKERSWDRKYTTQERKHTKDLADIKQKTKDAQTKIKADREAIKAEKKKLANEHKNLLRDNKPENKARVKDLEKELKHRDQTINDLQRTLNERSSIYEEESRANIRLRYERNSHAQYVQNLKEELAHKEACAATHLESLKVYISDVNTIKDRHAGEIKRLSDSCVIQRDNAAENSQRLVALQRCTFALRQANERLIREKANLEEVVRGAKERIKRLEEGGVGQMGGEASVLVHVAVGMKGEDRGVGAEVKKIADRCDEVISDDLSRDAMLAVDHCSAEPARGQLDRGFAMDTGEAGMGVPTTRVLDLENNAEKGPQA